MYSHTDPATSRQSHPHAAQRPRWTMRLAMLGALMLVLGLWLMPPSAQAAADAAPIGGSGTLSCTGSGKALLLMHGRLSWTATGVANLGLHDAAVFRAEGEGKRVDAGRWTRFAGWNGTVSVRDARFQARMQGEDITFTATGRGRAWVSGAGECTVNGKPLALSGVMQVVELE